MRARLLNGLRYRMILVSVMMCNFTPSRLVAEPFAITLQPTVRLSNPAADDQDDMAFWIDRTAPSRSTVISSDKSANKLFVYDLAGKLVQSLDISHPGNIDVRQEVSWGAESVAIVAVNERDDQRMAIYQVDSISRQLQRIDQSDLTTAENYGSTLFRPRHQGKLFCFCTSKQSGVQQIELIPGTDGAALRRRVIGHWDLPTCEGIVADDITGDIYVSVEQQGVYCINTLHDPDQMPRLVIPIGSGGFLGDVEGVTLLKARQGSYLIVSDQGSSEFRVYRRDSEYAFVGKFSVAGAERTDGIDITTAPLGNGLAQGAFACHSDVDEGRTVLVVDIAPLLTQLGD